MNVLERLRDMREFLARSRRQRASSSTLQVPTNSIEKAMMKRAAKNALKRAARKRRPQ